MGYRTSSIAFAFSRFFKLMLEPRFAGISGLIGVFLCSVTQLGAQQLRVQDLPGHEHVAEADRILAATRPRVAVRDLHWRIEDGRLFFTLAGGVDEGEGLSDREGQTDDAGGSSNNSRARRLQVDLLTGTIEPATDEPRRDRASEPASRRNRVGRARQATSLDSPCGKWKAVYSNYNVVLEPVGQDGIEPIQVTSTGDGRFRYGTACWVYGEELDQQEAMWFSPDSKKLAFYEIDERHMQTYFLTLGNTDNYTRLHTEQYPKAGTPNPHVRLLIFDIESRTTTPTKIDGPVDTYVFNIFFSPQGDELIYSRTNRWQNKLDVMAANSDTGESRLIVSEEQTTWQKNRPLMQFLADGERFIWETERNGWKNYELRHIDGRLINPLTSAENYPCERVLKVDEEGGWLYYSAFSDQHPLNSHIHRVKLDGSSPAKLTQDGVTYALLDISPDHQFFVCEYQTISNPPCYSLMDMQGNEIVKLAMNNRDQIDAAGIAPAELFSFLANDGTTVVYGTLQKPLGFDPNKKYPLLVSVYGGPSSGGVTNRYLHGNSMCQYGFLVAKIGNRGTNNRGKSFESAGYLKLGLIDLDDQADGVKYLSQREYIDEGRVGIFGTSYGGYMSALALLRYPDRFHVAVAGAPVTDWKNYDTIYTERYMRTPQENPEGYQEGSCIHHADQLIGKLFLMHGLIDDNVHPSNVWQLAAKFQNSGKNFDMMIYPNSGHGGFPNSQSLSHDYFIRHLSAVPIPIPRTDTSSQE
ncbi:MAG TPA: DPP IV N-terminal domain-containing protein [Pirellulaceae bacterium]|nr:DPP IV N-terminal domain-containing protein [Pirellulaceae bacterium]HMO91059.1 DPP IV N-terminal domain-containing protein [Pirellulaceae bacterium]HMP68174.1 DPP IV N-terminal domain-containing protein [Pirellulaceae bacterium]